MGRAGLAAPKEDLKSSLPPLGIYYLCMCVHTYVWMCALWYLVYSSHPIFVILCLFYHRNIIKFKSKC